MKLWRFLPLDTAFYPAKNFTNSQILRTWIRYSSSQRVSKPGPHLGLGPSQTPGMGASTPIVKPVVHVPSSNYSLDIKWGPKKKSHESHLLVAVGKLESISFNRPGIAVIHNYSFWVLIPSLNSVVAWGCKHRRLYVSHVCPYAGVWSSPSLPPSPMSCMLHVGH